MSESRLKRWWRLDEAEERATADNPLEPLGRDQRRPGGPLLARKIGAGPGFRVQGQQLDVAAGTRMGPGAGRPGQLLGLQELDVLAGHALASRKGHRAIGVSSDRPSSLWDSRTLRERCTYFQQAPLRWRPTAESCPTDSVHGFAAHSSGPG